MTDARTLKESLERAGLDAWADVAAELAETRLSARGHGDFPAWQAAVDTLPALTVAGCDFAADTVSIDFQGSSPEDTAALRDALQQLKPWRKGPFRLGGVTIDTEWRSDLKWRRLKDAIAPLDDRLVLDIGCGNGYYAFRMLGAGARQVIGVDPTLLFSLQFAAINRYAASQDIVIIPARDSELPAPGRVFDSVFSMGVLYHQRAPIDHLRSLRAALRPGGQLVLETIVLPGEEAFSKTPADRYARMRNVWHLPSVPELAIWLERAGFRDIHAIDLTLTTTDEQRATEWMEFESLAEALDPEDHTLTVEGWPAPHRAVLTAMAP